MGLFWETSTPLASSDIKSLAVDCSWSEQSLGAMIVRLVKLGFLEVAGHFQKRNLICNTYIASISKDQYYSNIISASIGKADTAFVLGFLSNLKESGNINKETIDKMKEMIDDWGS